MNVCVVFLAAIVMYLFMLLVNDCNRRRKTKGVSSVLLLSLEKLIHVVYTYTIC